MHKQIMIAALLLLAGCGEAPTSQTTGGEAVAQRSYLMAFWRLVRATPSSCLSGKNWNVTASVAYAFAANPIQLARVNRVPVHGLA